MVESVELMRDDIAHMKKQIDDIHACLYVGNGRPSIMTRMRLLEVEQKKHSSHWERVLGILINDVVIAGVMYFLLR